MSASPIALAAAALAAVCAVAAIRESLRSWPAARTWIAETLAPLERASAEGYEPTDRERRRLWLLTSLAAGALLLVFVGAGPYLALVGIVPLASDRWIAARRRRYRGRFDAGIGAWARALGDAIAAGQPVRAAVLASTDGAQPALAPELARLRADIEAGAPLAVALRRLQQRIGSPGLPAIAGALAVAARSGGDVGALLHRFAAASDERAAVIADARSATAQARMTGVAVAAMPVAGLLFAELAAPGFTAAMIANPVSSVLLLVSGAMQIAAFVAIRRISGVSA